MNAIYRKAAELGKDDAIILTKVGRLFRALQAGQGTPIPLLTSRSSLSRRVRNDCAAEQTSATKLARSYLVTGDRGTKAIKYLEDIIKDSPLRFETYELLGETLRGQGRPRNTRSPITSTACSSTPAKPRQSICASPNCSCAPSASDRAVEIMQAARKKFPDVPSITLSPRASPSSQAKRHPEAMAAFSDAQAEAEVRPRGNAQRAVLSPLRRGRRNKPGSTDKARGLDQAEPRDGTRNSAEACNYLGYIVGRPRRAPGGGRRPDQESRIHGSREGASNLDSLGLVLFQERRRPNRALTELLRAHESIVRETKKGRRPQCSSTSADTYSKLGKDGGRR